MFESTQPQLKQQLQRLQAASEPFVMATVISAEAPTSAKPGAKAIVTVDEQICGWIGGGCAQPAVLQAAREALKSGEPLLIEVSKRGDPIDSVGGHIPELRHFSMGCHSGGRLTIFIEPINADPVLLILGDSPTALALAELAPLVGFKTTIAGVAPGHLAETIRCLDNFAPETLSAGLGQAMVTHYAVIATQGKRDMPAIRAALATPAEAILLVASRRKYQVLHQRLVEEQISARELERLVAPAGLDIGARTPMEIALSIAADLVTRRRSRAFDAVGQTSA